MHAIACSQLQDEREPVKLETSHTFSHCMHACDCQRVLGHDCTYILLFCVWSICTDHSQNQEWLTRLVSGLLILHGNSSVQACLIWLLVSLIYLRVGSAGMLCSCPYT